MLSRDWSRGTGNRHKVLIRGLPAYHVQTGKAIRMLHKEHKDAIMVMYGLPVDKDNELTTADKAKALGIPKETLRSRVKAARRKLRAHLGA